MAESLELDTSVKHRTAIGDGLAPRLSSGLARFLGCEPGSVAAFDVLRIALGAILLTAAALKVHQLALSTIAEDGILTSRWFLTAWVEFELALGDWLLCGAYQQLAKYAAIVCFGLFAAVSLLSALRGDLSCGCFGSVRTAPWLTWFLDVAATTALLVFKPSTSPATQATRLPWCIITAALLCVAPPVAMAGGDHAAVMGPEPQVAGTGGLVVLDPDAWVGKPFPLLRHIDTANDLGVGRWIVLLYHHDCNRCKAAIEQLARSSIRQASGQPANQIALVEVPPYGPPPQMPLGAIHARLGMAREWFVAAPVEITVDSGQVVGVRLAKDLATASGTTKVQ